MNNSVRHHGLDALRAFAMLMGIVLHASMFYVPGIGEELGYELTGIIMIPTSELLGLVFFFIHTWRMPVFFLLAGFFARLMVQRRGTTGLLKNRLIRILVPLAAGVFIYNLVFHFGTLRELHHLWFLYDLTCMYLLLVCMKYATKMWPTILTKIDWVFGSTAKLWWLMAILLPVTTIGRPVFVNWINPNLGVPGPFFILGFTYVLIGWFMHRNTQIISGLARTWKTYLILGIITFGFLIFIFNFMESASKNISEEETGILWLTALAISPVSTFLIIMGFIGGAQTMFQNHSRLISYFVDASYWIYLAHLVVVFALGGAIIKNTYLDPISAVLINIVATTAICIATYHIFVRYTPLGWILHGKKGQFLSVFRPSANNAD